MLSINQKIHHFLLYSSVQYYFIIVFYLISFYSIYKFQNPWIISWIFYVLVPALDEIMSDDSVNPTKEQQKELAKLQRFKVPLYLAVIVDWIYAFWLIQYMTTHELSYFQIIGCILSSGLIAASNINVSHELIHKEHIEFDSLIGSLTLSRNFYMHYGIEHVHGHHKHVATPEDPATSKLNQSLYEFLPQTFIGTFKSAWDYEAKQLMRNKGYKHPYVIENRMLWYSLNNIILPFVIYKIYGVYGMIYFVLIGLLGALYLEVVNYIEHYGLSRKKLQNGEYEKINISHSWNAPQRASNYLLFKLQRHSDHHDNGYKPYQTLCTFDESPQFPKGYPTMIITALFPQVWFDVVNQYIQKYNKGEVIKEDLKKEINQKIMICFYKISVVLTFLMILGFYF